jgi:hypothetical protein
MFVAGWVFGPIREFFVGSGSDPFLAALVEASGMALVMVYSSGWAVRLFGVPAAYGPRVAIGLGAVALLLVSDLVGDFLLRGWLPRDFVRQFATAPGRVFGAALLLAVVFPLLRARAPGDR